MRKNILIFGHGYATQFIDINNQYTQLFDPQQYEITIVYLVGEPNEAIRQKHIADHVIFLNAPKTCVRGLKIPLIKQMLTLCRDKQFEIVFCHRYKPSYIMMWVALFYRIPRMFFIMHELNTLSYISRKIMTAILAQKNMFFAGVSDAVRDNIRQDIWRIPPKRVITLHNMIDVEFTEGKLLDRQTARNHLGLENDVFLFGNLGRLVKNKDQKTLIEAFSIIKPLCPNAKLIILGEGQLEQHLKKQARRLNLSNDIIFTGFMPDGFRYMKAFDTYISSSTQEAFGRVLLEAMIAQVPIIATKVNGVPEVIGDAGVLIDAANPKLLANAMLKAYQSPAHDLNRWGGQGYLRAITHFSQQKFKELFWSLPTHTQEANS